MRIIWKGPIESRRLKLLEEGKKYGEIARILSKEFGLPVSYDAVASRCKNTRMTCKTVNVETTVNVNVNTDITSRNVDKIENMKVDITNLADLDISNNHNLFEGMDDDYDESIISLTPQKVKLLKGLHKQFTDLKPQKILSLSDLHSPFINFRAVNRAIMDNLDADIVILNGDVYDGYAMSHFDKIKDVSFDVELKKVEKLLDVLTARYKYVIWVGGNHDLYRFEKFVAKNCGGMKDFFMQNANPMDHLAKKYNNVVIVPHNWLEIGNVIFSHPEEFSITDMKTVVQTDERFQAIKHLLPDPNYRGVIIGHTHHFGKIVKNDKVLMEQGCLCHLYDYKFQRPAKNRWELGYAVVEFDNNMKMIVNKSNVILIEE